MLRRVSVLSLIAGVCFAGGACALAACQAAVMMPQEAPHFMRADYGLHYVDTGDTAKLAYGRSNSEDMSLMLECAKGAGHIEVTDVAHETPQLILKAGGRVTRLAGAIESGPTAPILAAQASADDPALKAFRRSGRLEVSNGLLSYGIAATPDERANIERFFASCEQTA